MRSILRVLHILTIILAFSALSIASTPTSFAQDGNDPNTAPTQDQDSVNVFPDSMTSESSSGQLLVYTDPSLAFGVPQSVERASAYLPMASVSPSSQSIKSNVLGIPQTVQIASNDIPFGIVRRDPSKPGEQEFFMLGLEDVPGGQGLDKFTEYVSNIGKAYNVKMYNYKTWNNSGDFGRRVLRRIVKENRDASSFADTLPALLAEADQINFNLTGYPLDSASIEQKIREGARFGPSPNNITNWELYMSLKYHADKLRCFRYKERFIYIANLRVKKTGFDEEPCPVLPSDLNLR